MVQVYDWMEQLKAKCLAAFGGRLLFMGLQGSYRRGEARETSDIDAVVILDTLALDDLRTYRDIVATMPEHEKACGFISGRQELLDWPRNELFQFAQDTVALHGELDGLLPPIARSDIVDGARIGASGLYHAACHAYIHEQYHADVLQGLYKGVFFLLQSVCYLHEGAYVHSKGELLPLLSGVEAEILSISMHWESHKEVAAENPDAYYDRLIRYTAGIMRDFQ